MGSLVRKDANALAAFGGVNPFAEAGRGTETGDYLKFNGNHGTLTYGSDDEPLPIGSYLVADLNTYAQGFICWKESEVVEEVMVGVIEGRPPREIDMTDHGPYDDADDGWREAGSISFVILEHGTDENAGSHDDVGKSLLFKTSTGGAVRALKKLSAAYGRLFMQKQGELPVIEVTADEYMPKNKKHGKKHAINFKIVGWITEDELASVAQGVSDDGGADYEDEPAPVAPKALAKPAAAAAPRGRAAAAAPAEAAPVRRRAAAAPAPEPEPELEPELESEDETPVAPVARGRRAAEPVEVEADDAGETLPAARGRSPGRGAPPENNRVRRFA